MDDHHFLEEGEGGWLEIRRRVSRHGKRRRRVVVLEDAACVVVGRSVKRKYALWEFAIQ
jgi:hypothetical protein